MGRPKKAAGPLLENEHVKELLAIMKANRLSGAEDLLAVIHQVGAMEKQLDAAVNELKTMRRELETMREESHPIKATLQNAVKTLEKNIAVMRERLDELKANIIDGCKNAVAARLGITATTLEGILTVKGQGRAKPCD